MELLTPRLLLREFRESDYEAFRAYDGDPEYQRYEIGLPPAEAQTQALLEKVITRAQEIPRGQYKMAITLRPDDGLRGHVSLTSINNPLIREWEIGWGIRRTDWGQGYATEAARAMVRFAFTVLNAHRVTAFCHSENAASYRVMEKLGMLREGCIRETALANGQWYDELVYSILEREFI